MSGFIYALGRVFVPIIFIVSGVTKFMDVKATANILASKNFPIPSEIEAYVKMPKYEAATYLTAGVEVVCGLLIVIGLLTRWAALVLAMFVALTVIFIHDFWTMAGEARELNQLLALKNLSIMGALLMLVAHGSGAYSVEGRSPPAV